jgi:PAS domain S-box-containing protein
MAPQGDSSREHAGGPAPGHGADSSSGLRYRILVDSLPDAIVTVDRERTIRSVNPSFTRLFGYTAEEALGRSFRFLHPDRESFERFGRLVYPLIQGRGSWRGDWIYRRKDGGLVRLEVVIARLGGEGSAEHVAILRDRSENRRYQNALRVLAETGDGVGEDIFGLLARELAGSLGTRYALVARLEPAAPATAHTLAVWAGGAFAENFSYQLAGTPCQNVTRQGPCFYPEGVQQRFPEDLLLVDMGVEGYGGTPLRDSRGRTIGVLAALHDRRLEESPQALELLQSFAARAAAELERREAEERVRASEATLRSILDASNDAIVVHSAKDGSIQDVNRTMLEMYGFSREEALGLTVEQVSSGEPSCTQAEAGRLMRKALEEGPQLFEWQARRKDGEVFPVEVNLRRAVIGGRDVCVAAVRDIAERKRAEEALRESERQKNLILSATSDMLAYYDTGLRVIWANRAAGESVGQTAGELVGRRCHEIWHRRDEPCPGCPVLRALETGAVQEGEVETPDGRHFYLRGYPVHDEQGRVAGLVEFGQDITDKKRAQEERRQLEAQLAQARKMDALGTLAGGIAHDFNNILAAIMGYSELAQDSLEDGHPARRDLAQITRASSRAKQLIRQILTFSRKSEAAPKPVSLDRVAAGAVEMLERTIPKMVRLHTKLAPGLPRVRADVRQMEQLLMNLVANAAAAVSGQGAVTVTVKEVALDRLDCDICQQPAAGAYVMLSVRDDGRGMDPETKAKIFEPFFTTKEVGEGTGLGLSTVYGIVTGHDGHLKCWSEPGVGTDFRVYLPVCAESEEPAPAAGRGEEAPAGGGEKVLVVDDEPAVRELAAAVLERSGYRVVQAASGEEALSLLAAEPGAVEAVVLDLGMPGMGGKACLAEMARLSPAPEVLVATGYLQAGLDEEVERLGAAGVVAKPYRRDELLAGLRRVLGGRG